MRDLPALPFLDLESQRLRREKNLGVLVGNSGNPPNITETSGNPPHTDIFKQKIGARRQRVIELKKLGLKILQIQQKLADEGQYWSYDTIKCDLKSITAEEELEELKRQQDADIALTDDRKVRLEYRDRQIERLTPRKSPEVQLSIANQIKVEEKNVTVMLAEYEQLIEEAAGAKAGDLQKNNSGEPVHKADSDAEASEISVA